MKLLKTLLVGALLGFATYNGYSPGPDDGGNGVPDGGATLALLAVAVVGLAAVARRSLKS